MALAAVLTLAACAPTEDGDKGFELKCGFGSEITIWKHVDYAYIHSAGTTSWIERGGKRGETSQPCTVVSGVSETQINHDKLVHGWDEQ